MNRDGRIALTVRYKNDQQIMAMTSLVAAYQDRDVKQAERILKGELSAFCTQLTAANAATITSDPFIRYFINDLLRTLRTSYIVDMIKPYTRLKIDFLADVSSGHSPSDADDKTLSIPMSDVENLVVSLILDGRIKGKIDQVNGIIVLDRL